MLAVLLVVPGVILELTRRMSGIEKSWTYREGQQFPTIAQTRKYDLACSIALNAISSPTTKRSRMLVASRAWARRSGREVVLLKDIACMI